MKILEENKERFDALGITHWHEGGYIGSRGLTITYERPIVYPIMESLVEVLWKDIDPVFEIPDNANQDHAYKTTMAHLQVAPGRHIKSIVDAGITYGDGTRGGFATETFLPWLLSAKPDTGFRSLKYDAQADTFYKPILDFCSLCNSAGNDANQDFAKSIIDQAWFGIGALYYKPSWLPEGSFPFVPTEYTSESEYVDFCAPVIYVPGTTGFPISFGGTSCAAPVLSGMIALVNDFFIDKIGRPLSQAEMFQFIKDNCRDLTGEYHTTTGKDVRTGYGVFILPPYETIDIFKYTGQEVDDMAMTQEDFNRFMDNYIAERGQLPPSNWSAPHREWAERAGIIFGDDKGQMKYKTNCSREEMVTFLHRFYESYIGG